LSVLSVSAEISSPSKEFNESKSFHFICFKNNTISCWVFFVDMTNKIYEEQVVQKIMTKRLCSFFVVFMVMLRGVVQGFDSTKFDRFLSIDFDHLQL
jgi:hypothetical protein